MNLKNISNETLLSETDRHVKNEREQLITILYHLKEIEARRLFSSIGFKSMFEYAVKKLGYSEDQAMRRISAMRLLKELPEIETKINSGALNLSTLGRAQIFFRKEKKAGSRVSSDQKRQLLEALEYKSAREADRIVLSLSSVPQTFQAEKIKPINLELSEVKFVADEQLLEKIKKLKGLLAHSNPQISMQELLHKLCDLGIAKWDPGQSPATSQKQRVNPHFKSKASEDLQQENGALNISKRKYIPIKIKREVWQQAKSQCENCRSQYALEIDHIKPISLGGANNRQNLRLLCRACNQRQAIEKLGTLKMQMHFG